MLLGPDNDIPTDNENNTNATGQDSVISSGDSQVQNLIYTEPAMTTEQTYGDNDFETLVDQIDETYSIVKTLEMPSRIRTLEFKTDTLTIFESSVQRAYIDLPSEALVSAKKRKFLNFAYAKFDVKLKFLVSAPKTTSGVFWICYSPYEDELRPRYEIANRDPAGITQYPGVKINLAESTSAELIVPYVDYREAYNIIRDSKPNVKVLIYLLTPLRNITTSTGKVTMTVEASLCNISLTCPTTHEPESTSMWSMQGLGENRRKGVISEVAGMVSNISGALSGVPVVGQIAKPVNFISNLVGGVASLIGFSRPITYSEQQNVTNTPARGYAHAKGIDNSVMLGFSQETELASLTNEFPSKSDEMDIDTILRTPGLSYVSEWKDGVTFKDYVVPFYFGWENTTTEGVQKLRNASYFEYLAMLFRYFRGDFVLTLEIAKTAFHAGKLEVFYCAGSENPNFTVDAATSYRVVWDISESNKLEFRLPFTYNKAFMSHDDPQDHGTIIFREVTPLQYNEGVEGAVDILIWKHYENVKFMCPVYNSDIRFEPNPDPEPPEADPNDRTIYRADGVMTLDGISRNLVRYQYVDPITYIWFQDTVGGTIRNIKTGDFKVSRFDDFTTALVLDASVQEVPGGAGYLPAECESLGIIVHNEPITKWYSQIKVEESGAEKNVEVLVSKQRSEQVLTQVGGEIVTNLRFLTRSHRPTELTSFVSNTPVYFNFYGRDNTIDTDMLTYFSYMYRMMRGGIRYKLFHRTREGLTYSFLGDSIQPGLVSHVTYNDICPVHEVELPYYNKNRRYIVGLEQPYDVPQGMVLVSTTNSNDAIVTQAGSDDFSFGLRVGPPRIYRVVSSVKTTSAPSRVLKQREATWK